ELGDLLSKEIHEGKALVLDERFRDRLAVQLLKFRLVIKQLQLTGSAGHEEIDHALCFRREMRLLLSLGILEDRLVLLPQEIVAKQRTKGHGAEADGAVFEKMPASLEEQGVEIIHSGLFPGDELI